MGQPTKSAPVIEEVKEPVQQESVLVLDEAPPAAPAPSTGADIKFKEVETVKVAEQINAKGDFVSDLMINRIEQHLQYLRGEKGFMSDDDRFKEQITFMETIGNSTTQQIDRYCLVTDYLMKTIRENLPEFKEGKAFRFMRGLGRVYSDSAIASYQNYMTMMIRIAGAYADRKRVFQKMDLDTITAGMPVAARNNINTYIRRLCE
ncbi:hypothetical protein NFI00_000092 [Salmonella enterica]|nr:hypothetical protein [Salmonella enterica subsp. enterica serovar Minnesota]EJI5696389.1 hypothetical protein [Salmonella enterica]